VLVKTKKVLIRSPFIGRVLRRQLPWRTAVGIVFQKRGVSLQFGFDPGSGA
jgi:hypothetical protein